MSEPKASEPKPSAADEAVTAEVIRSALAAAVEEASMVVVRSSHSTFVQEGADACAALLDASAQLVAQSTATSLMHSSSLRSSLPHLIEELPLDGMVEGDVFAMNDPYMGGIHANDVLIFRPVFADGRPQYFAGTLVHVADLGGMAAGGVAALATDVFIEGMQLPPVRLYAAGEPVDDLWRTIRANSRTPDKVVGDLHALVAGANVLARRVEDLLERYPAEEVARHVEADLDHAEEWMRRELARFPAGTYRGSYLIETDGLEPGRRFPVEVAVTVDGGSVTVDFDGTAEQSAGAINSSFSQTRSGVVYAVRCFVDPAIPMNEGCLRPLDIRLPSGTLVNPRPPAACGGRVVTVFAAIEAILEAFSAARPERAVAASGLVHLYALHGRNSGANPWLTMLYDFGGIGARTGSDGPDATGAFFLGGRAVIPQVEPLEVSYPIVVRQARLRPDSGGAGTWRGGLGAELSIEVRADAALTVRGDRMELPPAARSGGQPGGAGSHTVRRADGSIQQLAPKEVDVPLVGGDTFVLATSGGGGLGPPLERPVDHVAADVREGRVSVAGAARDYGVVVDEQGLVDEAATTSLRSDTGARP